MVTLYWDFFFLFSLFFLIRGETQSSSNSLKSNSQWTGMNQLFQKPSVLREDLSTLASHMNAGRIKNSLRTLVNKELGVPAMQGIFDGLTFENVPVNFTNFTTDLADSLDQNINAYLKVLERNRQTVRKYYDRNPVDMQVFRQFRECCRLDTKHLTYQSQFATSVNTTFSCDIVSPAEATFLFYPGKNLTIAFRHHAHMLRGLRWQYFISPQGSHIEYPAHSFARDSSKCLHLESLRHRAQFLASALPYPKHVVLLVEYGSSVSESQLLKVKSVAKFLLNGFSRQDLITVVAVAEATSSPCSGKLLSATWEAKAELALFIDGLGKDKVRTNHSLGFQEAFRLLGQAHRKHDQKGKHDFIFYVSRGLLSSIEEAAQVLAMIGQMTIDTGLQVQINTFPVMDRRKPPLWETQFLQVVAKQDFNIDEQFFSEKLKNRLKEQGRPPPVGKMVVVNASEAQVLNLRQIYNCLKKPEASLNPNYRNRIVWSEPHLDPVGRRTALPGIGQDWIVSVSSPVWSKDHFIGLIGQDISLEAITSALRYYKLPDIAENYAFLIDLDARIIEHPKYSGRVPWITSLAEIENWVETKDETNKVLLNQMLNVGRNYGTNSVWVSRNGQSMNVTYFWSKLKSAPFIVVIAVMGSSVRPTAPILKAGYVPRIRGLTYHRLDFRMSKELRSYCLNLKQLATVERGGVYLGPGSFQRPYRHLLSIPENRMVAASYWAHLGDVSDLIPNTGLKSQVKHDVGALAGIVAEWKDRFENSKNKRYILRRFAATPLGVMVTFPAIVMDSSYDPTTRDWFRRAVQNPGKIVVSSPYLDPSGGGYVVTLSHTIFEGKSAAMHSPSDRVVAVMGMDVPVTFLYKVLIDTLPVCSQVGMRCLIFEDQGYLVARGDPLLNGGLNLTQQSITITEREPAEGQHLSHQEPPLAVTLLQYPKVMRKELCIRYGDRTVQRRYQFNTTMSDALTVSGKEPRGCAKYQLNAIPGTNVFLTVINYKCKQQSALKSAFCPCSVSDRRCLLCTRMDPIECECPCQCPVDRPPWVRQKCARESEKENVVGSCDSIESGFSLPPLDPNILTELAMASHKVVHQSEVNHRKRKEEQDQIRPMALPQCISVRCEHLMTFTQCIGVVGCQWCLREENGKKPLEKPFCSSVASCFGGIRGRLLDGGTTYSDEPMSIATPVGPVAGAIMGVFVLLVIGVYCYRHQVTRLVESRASSGSGARLHLAVCDEDEQEFQFDHDGSKPDTNDTSGILNDSKLGPISGLLLASFERDTLPRQPPPQWRPGPKTESSDHGYSTMTDRNCDDSERGTVIEPLTPSSHIRSKPFTAGVTVLVANEEETGPQTKLLLDKNKEAPPPGQTNLKELEEQGDESFCEPHTLTTTAQVHAIDASG